MDERRNRKNTKKGGFGMKKIKIFVTGDGICPWCGMKVDGNDPETHHVHEIEVEQGDKN